MDTKKQVVTLKHQGDSIKVTPGLYEIANLYYNFESNVRKHITEICSPYCSSCEAPCCNSDFCIESIGNLWLSLVRELFQSYVPEYSKTDGWLTPKGCALTAGRPPVCYDYFCPPLLKGINNRDKEYAVNVMGRLVDHVGDCGPGQRHLVVLIHKAQLYKINKDKFYQHLGAAQEALRACCEVFRNGCMTTTSRESLEKILVYPEKL